MSGKSSGAQELRARLEPIVAEAVAGAGFELDAMELAQVGHKRQVKVVIDHDAGVELDQVAEASRAVSAALDANEDVIAGSYTLEVTSPGTDRPLVKPRHWKRARSRLAKITYSDASAKKTAVVRVGEADESGVRLLFDGKHPRTIGYADIERAVVEIEFRQPPAAELTALGLHVEPAAETSQDTETSQDPEVEPDK